MIVQDEKAHGEDVVLVDIEARGRTAEWLHVLAVCSLERKSGERGIGIFVSLPGCEWFRIPAHAAVYADPYTVAIR